jgi:hypothetical protein
MAGIRIIGSPFTLTLFRQGRGDLKAFCYDENDLDAFKIYWSTAPFKKSPRSHTLYGRRLTRMQIAYS